MLERILLVFLIFISTFFIAISYDCPLQSHPLSEICPIDVNLNMRGFNITNVGEIIVSGRIVASILCIGNDCKSSWPSIVESDPFWSFNISRINIGYLIKRGESGIFQSIIYEKNGKIGIGTENPQDTLEVIGNITASGIIRANKICVGENCSDILGNLSGHGIKNTIAYWSSENTLESTPFYVNSNFDLNLSWKSIFNVLWLNSTYIYSSDLIYSSGKVGISTYPEYSLDVIGNIRVRIGSTVFTIENTGDVLVAL
ncbi:MAG: hypothetical protein QW678_02690 [Candidatus Aenigmatarchaeota archaeon]